MLLWVCRMVLEPPLPGITTGRAFEFIEHLRPHLGLVQASGIELFFRSLAHLGAPGRREVYWAGRLVFCQHESDIPTYDSCFSSFFDDTEYVGGRAAEPPSQPGIQRGHAGSAPDTDESQGETRLIARATELERLSQADFASLDAAQRSQVHALIAAMRLKPPLRRARRYQAASKGVLHAGRTARSALGWLGEVGVLRYTTPRYRVRRCVLLLDISGSMKDYAETLALFGYSLIGAMGPAAEVFAMGTRLTRLTDGLRNVSPDIARANVADAIRDWQGGTRLGLSLRQFVNEWGQRGLVRGSVVIIASDGWESGEVETLRKYVERLKKLSYRLVWLNPHKSSPGYEPTAMGMRAALPHVHAFVGGASLDELAAVNQLVHHLCAKHFQSRSKV